MVIAVSLSTWVEVVWLGGTESYLQTNWLAYRLLNKSSAISFYANQMNEQSVLTPYNLFWYGVVPELAVWVVSWSTYSYPKRLDDFKGCVLRVLLGYLLNG